jgi:hypothetical protein
MKTLLAAAAILIVASARSLEAEVRDLDWRMRCVETWETIWHEELQSANFAMGLIRRKLQKDGTTLEALFNGPQKIIEFGSNEHLMTRPPRKREEIELRLQVLFDVLNGDFSFEQSRLRAIAEAAIARTLEQNPALLERTAAAGHQNIAGLNDLFVALGMYQLTVEHLYTHALGNPSHAPVPESFEDFTVMNSPAFLLYFSQELKTECLR